MRILWITNSIFPTPSKILGLPNPVYGGWMYSLGDRVGTSIDGKLAIATVYPGTEFKKILIERIEYFLLPLPSGRVFQYNKELEPYWERLCTEFQPDVVHIHGTEYASALVCMHKLPQLKYVISIQGIANEIANHYYAGISNSDILKNITFRDIIRLDTIFNQKRKYEKRGSIETEYLNRTKHVIGRTRWDAVHTKHINPKLNYYSCNESLRESFYKSPKWKLKSCELNTIFLSQATYPIKGLHQVLKAVAILKHEFHNIIIKVAGYNIIGSSNSSLRSKLRISGYGSYIKSLIKKGKLENNIIFLGTLTEEEMIAEYLKTHIFICPSSIENSPNSLGEAQILGVPSIAANVGGIPDMIEHGENGLLYQFEEFEMLAKNIRRAFLSDDLTMHLSVNGIKTAEIRHNPIINLQQTLLIYKEIVNSKE